MFLVHATIFQQWTSLLKNSASIEKRTNLARDSWRIMPVIVGESYHPLLNDRASDCWIIGPATFEQLCQGLKNRALTVEHLCQLLLKNFLSDCWRIVLATIEQSCQLVLHIILNSWTIVPVTVEELGQWLLKNYTSGCWRIVPVAVDELWQRLLNNRASWFFLSFKTYFDKILTSFSCKYFNYYWLFQFRIMTK